MDGKVAFITGAARGQGRSHAVRLAEEGAEIIAVDLCQPIESVPYELPDSGDLAETVKLVEELDRRIVAREADVRDFGQLQSAVAEGSRSSVTSTSCAPTPASAAGRRHSRWKSRCGRT
jgi:NAD(P)-dependent dehydrogenase (short-subunit alcohol dehydrogenase family)